MKTVFINMQPQFQTLGQLHVITHLERNGFPIKHVFLTKQGSEEEVIKQEETTDELNTILGFIKDESPDLIGLSLMTCHFFRARRLTSAIRDRFPETPVLWGGIHPSFDPEECIPHADYVCLGEGEDATVDLLQKLAEGLEPGEIPNIWRNKDGQVTRNDVRPLIQDLDAYPFPRTNWEHTYCMDNGEIKQLTHDLRNKYMHYNGTMYDVIVSRGCPFACAYCCNSVFRRLYKNKGKYVRYRSVDNVIEELNYVKKEFPHTKIINIQDDSFGAADEEYLEEFSEKYRSEIGLPLRLRLIATYITEKKMKVLARANTMSIIVGVQANDRINETVFNRHVTSEKILHAARLIKEHNIIGEYQLIGQNPYAIEQDMVEVCELLTKIPKPYRLQILNLGFFPNTALREKAVKDGIEVNELDGYAHCYGSYPEKFPLLRSLQEMAPHTPSSLILFFLKHRNTKWGSLQIELFETLYHKSLLGIKNVVMRNSVLVLLARKTLMNLEKLRARAAKKTRQKPARSNP